MKIYDVLAYVIGPYRDQRGAYFVSENIRRAREVSLALWNIGIPNICPHANTALFDGAAPDEVWLAGDLVMLRRCDFAVTVPGWEKSSGSRAEVDDCESRGVHVFHAFHGPERYYIPKQDILDCVRAREALRA